MQNFRTLFLFLMVCAVLYVLFFIIVINKRTNKFVHKFRNFALSNDTVKHSILDSLNIIIWKIIRVFSSLFSKSKLLMLQSKSFDKYILYEDEDRIRSIDLLTSKILLSFIFFILMLVLCLFDLINIPYSAILLISIVAYFIPNLILNIRFNHKKENVLNDILDALTIISTALNNGESIYKAIELVITSLDGAICDEFKKISSDLDYGLSINEAFNRFNVRMSLDVTNFICEILNIFNNNTNLKDVFSYIEKVLTIKVNLKKEEEIKCIGVKILIYIILFIPLILGCFLILNPDLAKAILNNIRGIGISFILISLVSLYGLIVYKILGVKL